MVHGLLRPVPGASPARPPRLASCCPVSAVFFFAPELGAAWPLLMACTFVHRPPPGRSSPSPLAGQHQLPACRWSPGLGATHPAASPRPPRFSIPSVLSSRPNTYPSPPRATITVVALRSVTIGSWAVVTSLCGRCTAGTTYWGSCSVARGCPVVTSPTPGAPGEIVAGVPRPADQAVLIPPDCDLRDGEQT